MANSISKDSAFRQESLAITAHAIGDLPFSSMNKSSQGSDLGANENRRWPAGVRSTKEDARSRARRVCSGRYIERAHSC